MQFIDEVERLLPGAVVETKPLDPSLDWSITVRHSFGRTKLVWSGTDETFDIADDTDVHDPSLAAWKVCGEIVMMLSVPHRVFFGIGILIVFLGFALGVWAMISGFSMWFMVGTVFVGASLSMLILHRAQRLAMKRFDETMGRQRLTSR